MGTVLLTLEQRENFVCLFFPPFIYFILYYKIEELKMLFVELNIRLQE